MSKKHFLLIGTLLLALGATGWFFRTSRNAGGTASGATSGSLSAIGAYSFDFGTISMAAGNVEHTFTIENASGKPVTLTKLYTSCMCTTALYTQDGRTAGPFGMPGHGQPPPFRQTLEPGRAAEVKAVFDPAAHGPAGVGPIGRVIYLVADDGKTFTLQFSATVTP